MSIRPLGRLAPTPSGDLHLGNALSFAMCWLSARAQGGTLVLRMEDIDTERSRIEVAQRQREDLLWLGLDWDTEVLPQSQRDYQPAIEALSPSTYRCGCTRKDWAVHQGFCDCARREHSQGALRLKLAPLATAVSDRRYGPQTLERARRPDPKLVRRDGVVAYNLAVVVDDIRDGVTEVVRGADLLEQTSIQAEIFHGLGATPPSWLHVPLLLGTDGRKLSKSHGSQELRSLREKGVTAGEIWLRLLPIVGIHEVDDLQDAICAFSASEGARDSVLAPFSDIGT